MFKCLNENDNGSILIFTIVIMFIFCMVLVGILGYASMELRVTRSTIYDQQAFQIAEAGANYYEWHLANYQNDFWDGNASTTPGPYVHNYTDPDGGQVIGKFSLAITRPTVGSTIVTVQSTGYALANPKEQRTVTVRYGIPSLAQYAFLTNTDAWIGPSESVSGQFMTNGGLRFDGTGNAAIMSAKSTYNCKSWSGSPCPHPENGIWGSAPQSTKNFWQFPVPNVDFSSMTADLAALKNSAQSGGIYLAPSNAQGYSLVFKSNGTIDFYTVTTLNGDPSGVDVNHITQNKSVDYRVSNGRSFLYNKSIPSNGIIYVEDNTWVEGTVKGRAMVAAALLPYNSATAPNIMVQNNVIYAARDGANTLGLLAQGNFLIGYTAPDSLEIDAAIIAQNGSAEIYNWANNINTLISIFGSTASFGQWTWSYVDGSGHTVSGYTNTSTTYDSNLLYSPPPSFPLSASGYQQISWSSN
jgi:Tfp pilus assembly protein PilX